MQSLIVAFLAIAALAEAKPYHGYEQPDYTLDKYQPKDNSFEVRRYAAANWTSTKMVGMAMESSKSFMRLFDYIEGDNKKSMKIPMTVPVTIQFHGQPCIICNHSYIMSFYLPKAFQSSAPEPNNPAVYGEKRYDMVAFVRTFDGYAKEEDYQRNVMQLHVDLQRNGITDNKIVTDYFYGASYDSPFHFFARRNEVWVLAAK